jgi:anti-sigma regulatory factor (Ser/Thr protein kinase)
VPWNKRTLAVPASPPSVRVARDWVTTVLREIGHDDLTDSARLAVSELVTNAILHAEPPMTVTVRGTPDHPRIEVTDHSLVPPQRRHSERLIDVEDDRSWATIGRGLDLVASYSVRWGADISPNGLGKVVWFEPSATVQETPTEGEVFTMDDALADLPVEPADPSDFLTVRLLGMPVELFTHLRRHFNELGRELRLLAITNGDRYPLAVQFAETYLQVEFERRQVVGLDVLDQAVADRATSVDLTYLAPPTAPTTMTRLSGLLDEVYEKLSGSVLLSVRPPDDLIDLEQWYFGEFVRQEAGEAPTPWDGPTRLILPKRREVS